MMNLCQFGGLCGFRILRLDDLEGAFVLDGEELVVVHVGFVDSVRRELLGRKERLVYAECNAKPAAFARSAAHLDAAFVQFDQFAR